MGKWAIFYDDGHVLTDQECDFCDALACGVQVIAIEDKDCGRLLLHSHDYYWFDAGQWYGGDLVGVVDYIMRTKTQKILFGRFIARDRFRAIYQSAVEHPYLPMKSAWYTGERFT